MKPRPRQYPESRNGFLNVAFAGCGWAPISDNPFHKADFIFFTVGNYTNTTTTTTVTTRITSTAAATTVTPFAVVVLIISRVIHC